MSKTSPGHALTAPPIVPASARVTAESHGTGQPHLHMVPLSILSEIAGKSQTYLEKKMYPNDVKDRCVPLSILPQEQQDDYTSRYLLRGRQLDLDLLHAAGASECTRPWNAAAIRKLISDTMIVRHAERIRHTYAYDRTVTRRLSEYAASCGCSLSTVNRKRRTFMNNSALLQLLDNPQSLEDTSDRYRTCCLYARDYIIERHLCAGRPSDNKIFRELSEMKPFPCSSCPYHPDVKSRRHGKNDCVPQAVCRRNREFMCVPNRRDTVNLITSRINEQMTCLAWEGVRSWASKHHHTTERRKPDLVNLVWFSDHHELDIMVITGHTPDGKPICDRPWITGIMDAATNAMVGYSISTQPNSDSIAEAFARACAFKADCRYCGLPVYFYIDNGKDYRSNRMKGLKHSDGTPLYLNREFGESGLLEWFGVTQIHALPYRGCSKTIEAIWHTVKSEWISDLPGYCGGCKEERPPMLEQDIKNGRLYTIEQFVEYFANRIYPEYNAHNFQGNRGESPDSLYDRLKKADTPVPTWRTLAVLKNKSELRSIHRNGIRYRSHVYWCSALAPFIETGTKARVFAFDTPFNRTISVVIGSVYVGEARLVERLDLVESRRYRVLQHLQEQKEHRRAIQAPVETVHNLILQTDILDRALDIPSIDPHTQYVQQIDTEKDTLEAVDDARIPEEIKQLAVKPVEESPDDPEEPGDTSRFFSQLAKSKRKERRDSTL